MIFFSEQRIITVLIGDAGQVAVVAVSPPMIRAAESFGVASFDLAHRVGPMSAAVHKQPYLAIIIAHHNYGLMADVGNAEISRPGNLAGVAHIHPAPREDFIYLLLKNGRVRIYAPMDPIALDQCIIISSRTRDSHSSLLSNDAGEPQFSQTCIWPTRRLPYPVPELPQERNYGAILRFSIIPALALSAPDRAHRGPS